MILGTIALAEALKTGEVSLYSSTCRHDGVASATRLRGPDRTMSIRVVSPSVEAVMRRPGRGV